MRSQPGFAFAGAEIGLEHESNTPGRFFMRSLCPMAKLRMEPLYPLKTYSGRFFEREANMPDLIYLGLGVVLFVAMGLYARACGRL